MVASCWRCQAPTSAAVCAICEAPQPLDSGTDLFALLGLPTHLEVNPLDLEQRYHALSRAVHPDRHQTAEPRARQLSLALAAEVNRAYRTVRDPVARGRYWLAAHGRPLGMENNQVPPTLVTLVFETQEELCALRERPSPALRERVAGVRDDLLGRVSGLENALVARYATWSATEAADEGALRELRARLSELAYLATLLADVDAALGAP